MAAIFVQLAGPMVLLAEAAGQPAAKPEAPGGGGQFLLLLFGLLAVMFYFMVMRPQKREQARRQDLLNAVKPNDHVVTIGGIYGVVTNVHREADQVTIKVDESNNTKIRVTLSSIARIAGDEPSDGAAKK
jgi:preprotein translocase subunit YajC